MIEIRKIVVQVDETHREMGQPISPPTRRALAMAVIKNPYAGRYCENLDELIDIGEQLGGLLGERCVRALGITPNQVESYGKAAIVGEAGELEHAAAILHPKLGAPLRKAVEKARRWCPRRKKWVRSERPSTCRSDIKTQRLCAAISMRLKRGSAIHRAPMRLLSPLR